MKKIGMYLLMMCLLLGGCGAEREAERSAESTVKQTAVEQGNEEKTEQNAERADKPMQENTEIIFATGDKWNIREVRTIPFEEPEEGYQWYPAFFDASGSKMYMLRQEFDTENGEAWLNVQVYDCDTETMEKSMISAEIPGYETYSISSIDLNAKGEISLKLLGEKRGSFVLVTLDLQGNVLHAEEDFPTAEEYPWNQGSSGAGGGVYHLADGRVIVTGWDMNTQAAVLRQYEEGSEMTVLGKVENGPVRAICSRADEPKVLYCLAGRVIVRWDMEKDIKEEVFHEYTSAVEDGGSSIAGLNFNTEGEMFFCLLGEKESKVYVLTDKKAENGEELRLACLKNAAGMQYIERGASSFAVEKNGMFVATESVEEQYQENYRDRVFAELIAGKGPDIMWVSREDMLLLQEKGLLCNLSDMIPKETQEIMLPGVLKLCTVNGEYVGFVPEATFTTMVTSDEVWSGETWTEEEFAEVLESRDDWEWPMVAYSTKAGNLTMFMSGFFNNPEASFFVDMEKGISYFNGEDFVRAIKLCKPYVLDSVQMIDAAERKNMVQEGRTAAYSFEIFDGIKGFSEVIKNYGDKCHIVGYPTKSGSGSYVQAYSYGYLVVNANTKYKKEIGELFTYLLSYEKQYETVYSVRMDVLRDSVVYSKQHGKYMLRQIRDGEEVFWNIPLKPDKTSYMEEFMEFAKNCEPIPVDNSSIDNILREELKAYFSGTKTAEETADIIHRRVQLYLDENK